MKMRFMSSIRRVHDVSALILNILKLFRWQFWGVSLIPVLIGYSMNPQRLEWPQLTILLIIFGPCLEGAAEAINDYFDAETDRPETIQKIVGIQLSGGTGLLQMGTFSRPTILGLALFAYATGFVLAACFFPLPFIVIVIIGALIGLGYSAPPLRFKARGFLGPLSVGISFGCVTVLAGFTAGGTFPQDSTILKMFPVVLLVTGLFLTHQIVDYQADLKESVRTFCVRHGIFATRIASGILILLGTVLIFILFKNTLTLWPAKIAVLVGLFLILTALARNKITPIVRVAAVFLQATVAVLCLV